MSQGFAAAFILIKEAAWSNQDRIRIFLFQTRLIAPLMTMLHLRTVSNFGKKKENKKQKKTLYAPYLSGASQQHWEKSRAGIYTFVYRAKREKVTCSRFTEWITNIRIRAHASLLPPHHGISSQLDVEK